MELSTSPRNELKKSLTRACRRQGKIPAVVYAPEKAASSIMVDRGEFASLMRNIRKGHLPNTVFTLKDEKGQQVQAIVKDIQYHKVTYDILHLDFLAMEKDQEVVLNVPVEMVGHADCAGVKAGGAIRLVKRHIRVKCLPQNIPTEIEVNVADLQIGQSKRVRDMVAVQGIEIQAAPIEVVATVGKR